MSLKAKLSIVLKADDVVIAETQDAKLWLKMLSTMIEEGSPAAAASSHETHASEHGGQEAHSQASSVSA